ncbi:MAG: hypothetical protein FJ225_02170 [Lentisphaerae bacterium]|nr:hypothetical protein [Lentisphaerota bacterium]
MLFKAAVHYYLLALLGCAFTLFAVPYARFAAAREDLRRARELLASGRWQAAASRLEQARPWAEPHPRLRQDLECELIRCFARAGDIGGAEQMAEEMARSAVTPFTGGAGLLETIQTPARAFINTCVDTRGTLRFTRWSGYEALLAELRGDGARLAPVAGRLRARHPGNPVALAHARAARPAPARKTPDGSYRSDETRWGIVKSAQATAYDTGGQPRGKLAAGTTVAIARLVASASGDVAVCTGLSGTPDLPSPFVLKTADLVVRRGSFDEAGEEEKALVRRKAEVEARIADAQTAARDAALRGNPHRAEFERLRAEARAFNAEVKDLRARYDAAEGAERMTYGDRLRLLKHRETDLSARLRAARESFEEWNRQHAAPPANAVPADLQTQIAALDARLREMEPRR